MSNIVFFGDRRRRIVSRGIPDYDNDLSALLKETEELRNTFVRTEANFVLLENGGLEEFFFTGIYSECSKRGWLDVEHYHCARYAAEVCTHAISNTPQYWTAFEYLVRTWSDGAHGPEFLKKGGDACFLLVAVFQKHAERRAMKLGYYESMGSGLYASWHAESKREIGGLMSNRFSQIALATTECIHTMQNS